MCAVQRLWGVTDLTQGLPPAIEDIANLAKYLNGQTWSRHITLPRALHSSVHQRHTRVAPSDFTAVLQPLHDMLLRFCKYGALLFAVFDGRVLPGKAHARETRAASLRKALDKVSSLLHFDPNIQPENYDIEQWGRCSS